MFYASKELTTFYHFFNWMGYYTGELITDIKIGCG